MLVWFVFLWCLEVWIVFPLIYWLFIYLLRTVHPFHLPIWLFYSFLAFNLLSFRMYSRKSPVGVQLTEMFFHWVDSVFAHLFSLQKLFESLWFCLSALAVISRTIRVLFRVPSPVLSSRNVLFYQLWHQVSDLTLRPLFRFD